MNSQSLLLSMAIPAATRTLGAATQAVAGFASRLADRVGGESTGQPAAPDSFADRIAEFSERLREELGQLGIRQFQLRLSIDPQGQVDASVGGNDGAALLSHLQSNGAWLQELKSLASVGQQELKPASATLPHLQIAIDQHGTSHWARV